MAEGATRLKDSSEGVLQQPQKVCFMQKTTFQAAVAVALCSVRLFAADYTWTGLGADAKASTAADKPGCGVVRVANHPSAPSGNYYVDYPSTLSAAAGDGQDATWRLAGYGYLYVTRDAKVRDVWLEGSKPRIYLNGHKLRVRSFPHALGNDESVQVIPGGTAENPGRIIWNVATTIFVR